MKTRKKIHLLYFFLSLSPENRKKRKMKIKAWCKHPDRIREILKVNEAECLKSKTQKDSYFHAKLGDLRMREEEEKSILTFIKQGQDNEIISYSSSEGASLMAILSESMATTSFVEKQRESYSIENVLIHLDEVKGLGKFVKIQLENPDGKLSSDELQAKSNLFIKLLEINARDLVEESYRDLLKQNSLFSQILIDDE